MHPLKMLPKTFKKAATTNNGINNAAAVAVTTNSSTFSMLTVVPPTSLYNMMQGSKQLVQSKLKQTYSGSIYCILQDQNFHSTAAIQKDEKGRGNGKDKKGDASSVNNNDNSEGKEIICESTLDLEPTNMSRGVRQGRGDRCPKCNGLLSLRKNQQSLNNNEDLMFCKDCQALFSRGGSSTGIHQQAMRHAITEKFKCHTPKQLTAHLDKYVIGQDDAKKAVSQGVYDHYIRVLTNEHVRQKKSGNQHGTPMTSRQLMGIVINGTTSTVYSTDVTKPIAKKPSLPFNIDISKSGEDGLVQMEKANILFLGPSGVGKTYMIKILADLLNVPMAHADCTSMTQAGYVGEDVESVLTKLLQEANGDVAKAEKGIVFLDEIDKIAARGEFAGSSIRDVSGEGVQHALLKMVEGTIVNVKTGKKPSQSQDNTVQMDTTDILFIGSGAFTQIEKIIGKRIQKLQLGFGAAPPTDVITADDKEQEEINKKRDKLLKDVQVEDVIKFGIIPELCGRFPIRVPFYSLSREQLKQVIMEPKNSMLAQASLFFKLHDAILEITEEALDEIAGKAIRDKTGARALTSILHDVLKDAKYNLPGSNIDRVRITREYVRGESGYEVIEKNNKGRHHSQEVIHLSPTVAAAV